MLCSLTMIVETVSFEQVHYSELVSYPRKHVLYSEVVPLCMSLSEHVCLQHQFILKLPSENKTFKNMVVFS